jgi:predicted aldo/keto reductase-like oxidoreductase
MAAEMIKTDRFNAVQVPFNFVDCQALEELREIIRTMASCGPLSEDEQKAIEEYRRFLGKTWCHRCDYCQPCPEGIPISMVLVAKSIARRMPFEAALSFVGEPFKKAEGCTECRTCAERCPYGLDIPTLLKKQRESWSRYLEERVWS